MKKSLLMLFCLSMSMFLMAQQPEKQKEIGLVFSNFDNFGITYKTGTAKSLWRFSYLNMSGNNMNQTQDSLNSKQSNFGFGFRVGKEYRKEIANNLEMKFGADLSFSYSYSKSDFDDLSIRDYDDIASQSLFRPGFNLVFGLNYALNDNIVIGAEVLPSFTYTTGISKGEYNNNDNEKTVRNELSGFNYGLSNNSVLLSLSYRF